MDKVDEQIHELIAEYKLGEDAQAFLKGDLGRFLLGRAQQEIDLAREEMDDIDPHAFKEIRDLQNQIWRARSFGNWLAELIHRGNEALHTLETGENND